MSVQSPKLISVLGAGIIGLQNGISLLKAGYKVAIIARHFPGTEDARLYTSPWAGAQWRTHAGTEDKEQQRWDMDTYEQWMQDAKAGKGGIAVHAAHLYWPSPAPASATSHWWAPHVRSYEKLPTASLPRNTGIASGVSFTTATANVPKHLPYLLSQFNASGGTVVRASLPVNGGFAGALDFADKLIREHGLGDIYAFVNATGLGARELVPDDKMYPTRGQTVVVKGEAEKATTFEGKDNIRYVIPRIGSGTSILGGTKQAGNWGTEVDDQTTKDILEDCKVLAPELLKDGEFEVVKVVVGLRPSREGGARVEKENVDGRWVVHSYGHSGAGYQNSVGSANKVVRLVKELDLMPEARAKL